MAYREPAPEEPTIGKLVVDAFDDIGALIRNIIALAKAELKVSVRTSGTAIGLFAAAGFIALLGTVMLWISFAFFLVMAGLDPAWAFLIDFGGSILITALLGFVGWRIIRKVRAPERTIAQAKELPRAFSHND